MRNPLKVPRCRYCKLEALSNTALAVFWDRFRAKGGHVSIFQGLLPERPESGLDCLTCAMFDRLRSNIPLSLSAAAPDQPLSLKSRGRDGWALLLFARGRAPALRHHCKVLPPPFRLSLPLYEFLRVMSPRVATYGPMWGHPMPGLGALSPFLEPFLGHLSPKLDKVC